MSKAMAEIEVQVSEAKIVNAEVRSDGTVKLTIEIVQPENKEKATTTEEPKVNNKDETMSAEAAKVSNDVLKLVKASKLNLNDEFMQYEPEEGTREARFKKLLTKAIQSGTLSDFYRPKLDPSFDETGNGICYVAGKEPAVGRSFNWWKEEAEKVGLEVGTKKQYVAFLGCLIKELVEEGWDVTEAWSAVCSDSKKLGHYWNSEDAKHKFEMTGSRAVCGFCDLGNTCKILAEDEEDEAGGFWLAGGGCNYDSDGCPLADLAHYDYPCNDYYFSVVWLVLNR